ncbi:hypothetical protein AQUSIP_19400 [Aquicella siphonis]|uniref:DUF922 domain-containing protein n=1 Tax=Aquicella siphonis TaxID=254247 RepID=A0A5E4PJL0_9COXI|nr:DUF922 domain-containing protein [Aquicella siphonis]VVC76617.1 hypothetical protein AQUSIP_19400 [Aquicella siphonis]
MKFRHIIGLLILITSAAAATPVIQISESAYAIHGRLASELRAQMNAFGPMESGRHFDAYTHWNVKWHFRYQEENRICRITQVTVSADIQSAFPQWADYSLADKVLQNQWNQYTQRLRMHEKNHSANGADAAVEVENKLISLPPLRDCQQLETLANNQAQQILSKYNARDRQYDIVTMHGQTEGVIFP